MNPHDSDVRKIRDLIKDFATAMLITVGDENHLHARPMAIAEVGEDCALWFFTSAHGSVATEVARKQEAHAIFQKEQSEYLTLQGSASIVRDRAKLETFWKEPFRVWFPDGKDDPNLVLISFQPERAEYWDNGGLNKVAYLWEATRAYLTGNTPEIKEGEQHGVVDLA